MWRKKKQPTPRAEKHIEEWSKVGGCQKSVKTGRKKRREESSRRRDTYQKEKQEKTLDEEENTWSGLEPLNNNNINCMLEGRSTAASPQSRKKRNSIFSILNAHIYWLQSSPWHRLWFFFSFAWWPETFLLAILPIGRRTAAIDPHLLV